MRVGEGAEWQEKGSSVQLIGHLEWEGAVWQERTVYNGEREHSVQLTGHLECGREQCDRRDGAVYN